MGNLGRERLRVRGPGLPGFQRTYDLSRAPSLEDFEDEGRRVTLGINNHTRPGRMLLRRPSQFVKCPASAGGRLAQGKVIAEITDCFLPAVKQRLTFHPSR